MPTALDEIVNAVLALPAEQRELLLNRVEDSLTSTERQNEKLWEDVALRRAEELRAGKVTGIPWEKVKKEATRLMDE